MQRQTRNAMLILGGLSVTAGLVAYWFATAYKRVPPIRAIGPNRKDSDNAAALPPAAAENISDPAVDVVGADEEDNAASRRLVAQGRGVMPAGRFDSLLSDGFVLTDSSAQRFLSSLPPNGRPYGPEFLKVFSETKVSPYLLAAIIKRETDFGKTAACGTKGPACTNSIGMLGLGQLNPKYAGWVKSKLPNGRPMWTVPYFNLRRSAEMLKEMTGYVKALVPVEGEQLLLGAVSGYNGGQGLVSKAYKAGRRLDAYTDGGDYGTAVLAYRQALKGGNV